MSLRGRQGWIFRLGVQPRPARPRLRRSPGGPGAPAGGLILEYLASRPAAEAKTLGARLEALEAELSAECRPQPGIRDALEAGNEWRLGVVTRNSVANAHLTLAQLGLADLFAPGAVLGRESAEPKPSPDALHQLRREWDLPPERCVMLGDHGLDLAAGRAARSRQCTSLPTARSAGLNSRTISSPIGATLEPPMTAPTDDNRRQPRPLPSTCSRALGLSEALLGGPPGAPRPALKRRPGPTGRRLPWRESAMLKLWGAWSRTFASLANPALPFGAQRGTPIRPFARDAAIGSWRRSLFRSVLLSPLGP